MRKYGSWFLLSMVIPTYFALPFYLHKTWASYKYLVGKKIFRHSLKIYKNALIYFCFFQAYVVLGQFLVLKKNRDLFVDWLKDYAGANSKQSSDCYQCLSDWCDEFL